MSENVSINECLKGYFAGFYDPITGIKTLSMKFSTGAAVLFSLAGSLVLYVLEVIARVIILHDYMTVKMFFSIAFTSFMTYGILTFGVAGIAILVSTIQGSKRKYSELVSAATMAIIPGALIRTLWGRFGNMVESHAGSFFWALGTAYMAILLFEHISDDNLSGRKRFLSAAIITAAAFAIAASY